MEGNLDKWTKFENAINQLIFILQNFCKKQFSFLLPKIKTKINTKKTATEKQKKSSAKLDLNLILKNIKSFISHIKSFFLKILQNIKDYISSIKSLGKSPSGKFKRKPKIKEIAAVTMPFLIPILLKFKKWYSGIKPTTLLIVSISGTVGVITGVEVYKETVDVVDKNSQEKTEVIVEKVLDKSKRRPEYYKNQEKQLLISAVNLPVYIEKATSIKSLIIDFTLTTSNRYLKQFFYENEYLIKDRLNTTVRPVIPEFPLSKEGKKIIREKIQKEMNNLIKQWEIKGKIESVHFHNIIAS